MLLFLRLSWKWDTPKFLQRQPFLKATCEALQQGRLQGGSLAAWRSQAMLSQRDTNSAPLL